MPTRLHDRSHFFKYASFETAKLVIKSHRFRWSAPTTFNDPFDHQSRLVPNFTLEEFGERLIEASERIVFSEVVPNITPTPLSEMLMSVRLHRGRHSREGMINMIRKGSMESAARLFDGSFDDLHSQVQNILCHSRVFCVSEVHDNVVMWSHYADQHRGVVFKLRCIDDLDNCLLAARKVIYSPDFPAFVNADEYARHLSGEQPFDWVPMIKNIAYTKHTDWSYEREWRTHYQLLNQPAGDGYSFFKEDPKVFEAVYLGCRMEAQQVTAMCDLIRQRLPGTKIFRGSKSTRQFILSFSEISD